MSSTNNYNIICHYIYFSDEPSRKNILFFLTENMPLTSKMKLHMKTKDIEISFFLSKFICLSNEKIIFLCYSGTNN